MQATHAIKVILHNTVPIIDRTNPAVAIPDGFLFLAITPITIPTIPKIKPSHPNPTNTIVKLERIDNIPNTKDATANPLDFFSSIIHPPYFDIIYIHY